MPWRLPRESPWSHSGCRQQNRARPPKSNASRSPSPDTITAEGQTVVAALQVVSDQPAQMERLVAVRAAVFERYGIAVLLAIEHKRLAQDFMSEQRAREILGLGRHVPGISQKHPRLPSMRLSGLDVYGDVGDPPFSRRTPVRQSRSFVMSAGSLFPRHATC
jgi:hypothetical protein